METPKQTPEETADLYMGLAEGGDFPLDWRTQTQNDFIWLLDRKLVTGQITPLQAKLAFRDYSNYLNAIEAMQNGSNNQG